MTRPIVTRMAPSPTGLFHVGGVRTALYNFLYARKHKGMFILRIEDTDKERSKKEYEQNILDAFEWLGLHYDHLYRQSEHVAQHQQYLAQLISSGKAYEAEENEAKTGKVIRFKNPQTPVIFHDEVLGEVSMTTEELGDFVIARSFNSPLYHLAVVADDHDMGVTHVIRAQEHLSNTPRQILLIEALGFERPTYAHIPLVLAPDKSKLSKRHGAVAVTDYREKGYLPSALLNFLAMIGWNPGTDQEIFSLEELIQQFSLEQVQKSGGVFNIEKLNWINKTWLEKLSSQEFLAYMEPLLDDYKSLLPHQFSLFVSLLKERINVREDFERLKKEGEFDYLNTVIDYPAELLIWKQSNAQQTLQYLSEIEKRLQAVADVTWIDKDSLKNSIWDYAEKEGKGNVLWPLRTALSGKEKSPDPFTLLAILGKETSLQRIQQAYKKLQSL